MITKTYTVPLEVLTDAAALLHKYEIDTRLKGKGTREGTVALQLQVDPQDKLHDKVMDNIEYMIEEFNGYRFGEKEVTLSEE